MEDYTDILQEAMDSFELSLKRQLLEEGRKATGETINSIHSEVEPQAARLLGSGHLYYLVHGRGPTGATAAAGEPTLLERIKDWIAAKGLALNPYAVANSIHKKGTLLYQGLDKRFPGQRKTDTLEAVLNAQTLGDLRAKLGTAARKNISSELLNLPPL
jgi:hypothetical protein